jgi:hypothetical protein
MPRLSPEAVFVLVKYEYNIKAVYPAIYQNSCLKNTGVKTRTGKSGKGIEIYLGFRNCS